MTIDMTHEDQLLANSNMFPYRCSATSPRAADESRQHTSHGWRGVAGSTPNTRLGRDLVTRAGQLTDATGSSLEHGLTESHDPLLDARILIIDDCTLYRENLAAIFEANGTSAPGTAWDLRSLVSELERTSPSIVLLSIATRDSLLLLHTAMQVSPAARVIVLGVSEDDESDIVACAEAGVAGYHTRTESLTQLLALIRKVAAGEAVCSPRVYAILLNRLSALAAQRQLPPPKELVLTAREAQILRMLEAGLSNRDIADQLCIAIHTVKNHVHSLLKKLDVSTRAEAAALSRTIRYTDCD